jgi:putative ABC transport system permease protein
MSTFSRDIAFALRMVRRYPRISVTVILTLVLGLGPNVAIFSVVNAVLLRPLPFPHSEQLVRLWERQKQVPRNSVSYADVRDWREQNRTFDDLATYRSGDYTVSNGDDSYLLRGAAVSASLFSVLGLKPTQGRVLQHEEERPGANHVIVISERLRQRVFGLNRALVGTPISVNGTSYTVVGVMPKEFAFPDSRTELWEPLAINPMSPMAGRGMHYLQVIGRLKKGVTIASATAEMAGIAARLEQQYPQDNAGEGVVLASYTQEFTAAYRKSLLTFLAAVSFLLLVVCANVANLLLTRASGRQREMAVRTAIGASRWSIVRQLLTESIVLSWVGGVAALGVARLLIYAVLRVSPLDIPRIGETSVDFTVVAFTFLLAALTAMVFGVVPALQASRPNIVAALREGGRGGTTGMRGQRVRAALIIGEVAIALALAVAAGLFAKSFVRSQRIEPGFRLDNVLVAEVNLPASRYMGPARLAFLQQSLENIRHNPQVSSASAISHLPLAVPGPTFAFAIQGRPALQPGSENRAELRAIMPGYFRTLGISQVEGREFTDADSADVHEVAIVSDGLARRYWGGESSIGKQVSLDMGDGKTEWREIIGVVNSVHQVSLEQTPEPQLYVPFAQFPMPMATFVVHTNVRPPSFIAQLRREIASADRYQSAVQPREMQDVFRRSVQSRKFNMLLLSIFAATAVVLTALGIYGVLSFVVAQGTGEIGIRLALGAKARDILWLVMRRGGTLLLIGIAVGWVAALACSRIIASMLFQVSAQDGAVFASVTLLVFLIATIAMYLPARRAMRVDPMVALRSE